MKACYCPHCGKHKDAPKHPWDTIPTEYSAWRRDHAMRGWVSVIQNVVLLVDDQTLLAASMKGNKPILFGVSP